MFSPDSEINSIGMSLNMRHSVSASSGKLENRIYKYQVIKKKT